MPTSHNVSRLKARHFLLPALALVIIGALPVPAESGGPAHGCGPGVSHIKDRALRATFERLDRSPSAAAAKICALYRNAR